jgi:septal ring factor EnvC (AmiA/AmiB activator)
MADNKEIEFETPAEVIADKAETTKLEGLESKVAKMETSIAQILSTVDKMSAKLSESKPEPVKEDNALKDSVTNVDKKVETLAKKVEELEAKPARMTQTLSEQVDAEKRAKEIASSINGAEMLVYAEKNHIRWGKGE